MSSSVFALLFLFHSLMFTFVTLEANAELSDASTSVDLDGETAEPVLDTLIIPRKLFPHERSDYRTLRETVRNFAERSGKHGQDAWEELRAENKAQIRIPEDIPFPCSSSQEPFRSSFPPTSVHRLRPGDIDVIGAMGDSLIAGSGVLATNPLQVYIEDRGMSFPIGGELSWRESLTIPNILKEFNPNLRGFSVGSAFSYEPASRLNVAEPGARVPDMLHQAKLLVKRMRADKAIQIAGHWKLITMMIGANDACHVCYEEATADPDRHAAALMKALDYLRDNLPRTLVSIIAVPDVMVALLMDGRSPVCGMMTLVECPCLAGLRFEDRREQFLKVLQLFQAVQLRLGSLPQYLGKDDFAVEIQPWTIGLQIPRIAGPGSPHDITVFSEDCFHFSQKGNALAANALWNNMMEPSHQKSRGFLSNLFTIFRCPTRGKPFLATYANSKSTKEQTQLPNATRIGNLVPFLVLAYVVLLSLFVSVVAVFVL